MVDKKYWEEKDKLRSKERLEYFKEYQRKRYLKRREWAKKHPELVRSYANEYYRRKGYLTYKNRILKKRKLLFKYLGNRCINCGFSDWRALQIDHVNGGGNKERKVNMDKYYKIIRKSIESKEGKYQLLCANCNWIKRYENNEVPYRIKGGEL